MTEVTKDSWGQRQGKGRQGGVEEQKWINGCRQECLVGGAMGSG